MILSWTELFVASLREMTFLLILSSLALIKEKRGCNRLLDFVSKLERNVDNESSLLFEFKSFVVSSEIDLWKREMDSWSCL